MKCFKSLNCCRCDLPFAPVANHLRSPRKLACGLTMCHGCFEKEKASKKKYRTHQCSKGRDCFSNPHFAYFLIDVISQGFIAILETRSGYVLSEPDPKVECPICYEEYSVTISRRAPLVLYCNHTICEGCFFTLEKFDHVNQECCAACPICKKETYTSATTTDNSLKEFLRELPRMIRKYEREKVLTQECSNTDCNTFHRMETMFNCLECIAKICGACAFRYHRQHEVNDDLVSIEVSRISEEAKYVATCQMRDYEEMFPELHNQNKKLIHNLKRKLLDKVDGIKKLVKIQDVHEEQEKIEKWGDKFEAVSEKYMSQICEANTELTDILEAIEKDGGG